VTGSRFDGRSCVRTNAYALDHIAPNQGVRRISRVICSRAVRSGVATRSDSRLVVYCAILNHRVERCGGSESGREPAALLARFAKVISPMECMACLAQRLRDGVWQFCRADGSVISPALPFQPRGQIVRHFHRNEISWRVDQGQLEFSAGNAATTPRFVSPSRAADGCLELSGPLLGDATGIVYILRELAAALQIICGSSTPRRGCIFARPASGWLEP
jgi:hypothetical protein